MRRFRVVGPPRPPRVRRALCEDAAADARLRVLVVDDHCESADAMATLCQCLGFEARCSYCGEDAIATAREFLPDIVILDLDMPALNGLETAGCITEDRLCGSARLIAMTGRGDPSVRGLCQRAGFETVLRKPVSREVLEAAIAHPPSPSG